MIDLTLDEETKQFIAYKTQEFIFDHIVDRINIAFKNMALKIEIVMVLLLGLKILFVLGSCSK